MAAQGKPAAVAAAIIGVLTLGLAWLIVADATVNRALETGVYGGWVAKSGDSRVLAVAADRALFAAKTKGEFDQAAVVARRALARGPLEVRALRDLGVIAAAQGRTLDANRILGVSAARSLHDGPSHLWLLDQNLRSHRIDAVFAEADILLRQAPERLTALLPTLVAAGEGQGGVDALAKRLRDDPPWRDAFLENFIPRAKDPAAAFALLMKLQDTSTPPNPVQARLYLERRLREGAYDQAYLDWLQFLPQNVLGHVGNIYDGDFAGAPGPAPFNWVLESGVGGVATMGPSPAPNWRTALDVQYDGTSTAVLAAQHLALPPGRWRLTGVAWTTNIGVPTLGWKVSCAEDDGHILAKAGVPMGGPGWRRFEVLFDRPDQGCGGQWLRLAAIPGDRENHVEIWVSGMAIARVATADAEDGAASAPPAGGNGRR